MLAAPSRASSSSPAAPAALELPDNPDLSIPWDSDTRLTRLMPDYTGARVERTIAGRTLSLETGRLGPFADGLVTARYGDSVVMASVVAKHEELPASFLPLSVEYREKSFAAGFIPTTWTRREGMLSDREILGARVLDRTVRPLFLKGFARETQIVASLLAVEEDCAPEVVGVAAAAAALMVSDVPWRGPAAAIRVGWVNGEPVINPTVDQQEASALHLLYSGTRDRCLMLEVGASELEEECLVEALRAAQAGLAPLLDLQEELAALAGRGKRTGAAPVGVPEDIQAAAHADIGDASRHLFGVALSKSARGVRQGILQSQCVARLREAFPDAPSWQLEAAAGKVTAAAVRDNIIHASSTELPPSVGVLRLRRPARTAAEIAAMGRSGGALAGGAAAEAGSRAGGLASRVSAQAAAAEEGEPAADAGAPPPAPRRSGSGSGSGSGSSLKSLGFQVDMEADGAMAVDPFGPARAARFEPGTLVGGGRVDGRDSEQIRPLQCEVSVLPVVHGSSVFARGGTQVLCTTTLGPPEIAQMLRPVGGGPTLKSFMLHYDFPPYSTNNTGRVGGFNRRMIGHGNLAEKALAPVMPTDDEFRFTVRVTSEVTGSDGSSSMATVTGATLALMDAGVPIRRPVAGVSVGMVTEPSVAAGDGGRFVLLTDIVGMEDHAGDMDFKVAGSRLGVTAAQLDIKLDGGVPLPLLEAALWRAAEARCRILDSVDQAMPKRRLGLKETAPRMELLPVPFIKRGMLIGPGGATIRRIQRESGASVRLLPDGDYAQVFARGEESLIVARQLIGEALVGNDERGGPGGSYGMHVDAAPAIEVGEEVTVCVRQLTDFGAICTVEGRTGGSGAGGMVEGLLHVSEMRMPDGTARPRQPAAVAKVGELLRARVVDVDPKMRAKFSMDDVDQTIPEPEPEPEAATEPSSGGWLDDVPARAPATTFVAGSAEDLAALRAELALARQEAAAARREAAAAHDVAARPVAQAAPAAPAASPAAAPAAETPQSVVANAVAAVDKAESSRGSPQASSAPAQAAEGDSETEAESTQRPDAPKFGGHQAVRSFKSALPDPAALAAHVDATAAAVAVAMGRDPALARQGIDSIWGDAAASKYRGNSSKPARTFRR